MGGMVDFSTTLSYRSLTHQFEIPIPALDQPGYALWDASIVWTSDNDRYSIGLHGKNLTDKHYITSGYNYQNGAVSHPGPRRRADRILRQSASGVRDARTEILGSKFR
jgi:outer membrane receptor protein involved in Fe transport